MKRSPSYAILCLFFLGHSLIAYGQDTIKAPKFHLKGYQKLLASAINFNDLDNLSSEQILHNRLEATWDLSKFFTLNAALRTQLYYGDLVKQTPNFGTRISQGANDYFDLDLLPIDRRGLVLHSVLDRLNVKFSKAQWEVIVGRQRINWGIATLWNPNDLFNAYNFTDFDYEERPGSDAFRVTWYKNWNTSFEIAGKMADSWNRSVLAIRAKFGIGTYDIQAIAGNYLEYVTLGGGFAGNLGSGSLKGEASFFQPYDTETHKSSFAGTVEYQRNTSYNLLYTFGALYNSLGASSSITQLFNFNPTAQNLYPYKVSVFLQPAYTFSPLLSGSISLVYSLNSYHPAFISPNITYSAAQNFDIDLFGQIVTEKSVISDSYQSPLQAFYLRFKYSF